jgi:signal transduction histidine kinase/ActR/RegA family two-component response regulator
MEPDQVSGSSFYNNSDTLLLYWQKKIFFWLFSLLLGAGLLPFLLSCSHALQKGQEITLFFYSSLYLWIPGVLFLNKIPFDKRSWAGIFWFYVMGLFSLGLDGFVGSSWSYFFCFLFFGAVFFGGRGGAITLLAAVGTLLLAGIFHFQWNPLPGLQIFTPWLYTVYVGTFFLLGAGTTLFLTKLIDALEMAGKEQAMLEEKLAQSERLKNMGILAGSVAHDLNNILSGIATYPEVLLMDEGLAPRVRQGLDIIKDSGQKASAVVSDLLTISRGGLMEMEVLNINLVVERLLGAADFDKIKAAYQQVEIKVALSPELLDIKGSYIHIEKAVMNLVINGAQETVQKEGGEVSISTANFFVEQEMAGEMDLPCGEYVMLSVTDNGAGISGEYQEKIFDPFFAKKAMGKSGTGLGLTLVWNTVQDHQGKVRVFSSQKGTRFELFFPAVRGEIVQEDGTKTLAEIKGQGERILVVDDLASQRKIASTILKNLGYQVFAVADGMAAVRFVQKNPVDLLVLDMVMEPSISGLETYQRIKKICPDQKAIIVSGYSKSEAVLLAQDLGAGAFVKKPYTILDMGIAVKGELECRSLLIDPPQ